MKAVILTASKNNKFYPFSETRTRSMLPCAGDFILGRLILQLKQLGVTSIYLVVKHHRELIQNYLEYGQKFDVDLHYTIQQGSGIGNALLSMEEQIKDDKFLLVYGDILTTDKHILSFKPFLTDKSPYSVASVVHPLRHGNFGNVYLDPQMKITKVIEKASDPNLSNYVLSGMYLLQNDIFAILRKEKEDMNRLFKKLIKEDRFYANLSEEVWIDISYPWDVIDACRLVMDSWNYSVIPDTANIKSDVNLSGNIRIGENCTINSGSTIQGPCYIGKNVFIGNNCLIREYSSIGDNCIIGFGSEIKSSILFNDVLIGRLSFIGDSVIGEGVQIGNYCTTVNYDINGKNISVSNLKGKKIDTGHKKLGGFIGDKTLIGSNHSLVAGLVIKGGTTIKDNISLKKDII